MEEPDFRPSTQLVVTALLGFGIASLVFLIAVAIHWISKFLA